MSAAAMTSSLLERMPSVRGKLRTDAPLADLSWFRVGGAADVLFSPKDTDDLAVFLKNVPDDIPITVLGVGSNVLIRDGGIEGVVIRLGSGFTFIEPDDDNCIRAGAAALDVAVAKKAMKASITGLEFMRGIPGTVGGALRMNAGAYDREVTDVLIHAVAINRQGEKVILKHEDMGFSYRHSLAPNDLIFVEALFQGEEGSEAIIRERMDEITDARESSQPVRSRTGGSTFKNPDPDESDGLKAWQLIDAAGCRGLRVGNAQVSEQHCNFLINLGDATAADLEKLGETVRLEVEKSSGIKLQWEIRRIGRSLTGDMGHNE